MKKVNKMEVLMNKKRNRQKPTALEHIRVKKIEAELHHKVAGSYS